MKCCVWCKHFYMQDAIWYSALTGGDDAELNCLKGHWRLDDFDKIKEFQGYAKQAENCIDFVVVDELKDEIEE